MAKILAQANPTKTIEKIKDSLFGIKYIEINPKDKDVLGIIYKTYYKLGNAEKGKEYKARFDAKE